MCITPALCNLQSASKPHHVAAEEQSKLLILNYSLQVEMCLVSYGECLSTLKESSSPRSPACVSIGALEMGGSSAVNTADGNTQQKSRDKA